MIYYKGKESLMQKKFSSKNLIFFTLGNIMGPQVFIMLGSLVLISGSYGLISLVVSALIAFLISLVYSELALSMPITGLVVNSVNDAFGGLASFIVGWSQLFGNVTFAAVSAMAFGIFIGKPLAGALICLTIMTLLELKGITELGKLEKAIVFLILLFFASLIISNIAGIGSIFSSGFNLSELASWKKIFLGTGFFFLAFTGFEDATTYSEEMHDVRKLPHIMFGAIAIISVFFILLFLVLLGGINSGNTMALEDPLQYLSMKLYGEFSHKIIAFIGMIASLGSLTTSLSTASRNIFSMAEKGFLQASFSKLSEKGIPTYAVSLSFIIAAALILSRSLEIMVYLSNFLYFFSAFFLAIAINRLREKRKKLERPFKIPFAPLVPTSIAILMVALTFFLELKSLALGFMWLFFGFILYMLRIIGELRLKLALTGGIMVCSFISVCLFLIIKEMYSGIFSSGMITLIFTLFFLFESSVLFILIFDLFQYLTFTKKFINMKQ